jgi:TolB-like protein/tetratricopeptide (TPR) repeat protein
VNVRFLFGEHSLDTDLRELRRNGAPVAVEPQVFDLLVHLLRHRDKVVSKDELLASVWGGRIVSDGTIDSRINAVRRAVGDGSLIRTFPRKGIRFVGEVREEGAAPVPRLTVPDRPSIAVLPFTNMSDDPGQDHFTDGMVEDLITNLSRLHWLFVIARNSTFTYKDRAVDVRRAAEELGVRYVVEGSVRRVDDRVRVTAQLIEAESGRHVWADRYDRSVTDIFAVQDAITDTISAVLEPEISHAERERARRKPPENLGAWELYQRGMWFLLRRNRETLAEGRALLREAIALDPDFSSAHAALGVSEFWLITHGITTDAEATRAALLREGTLAVNLDPRDPLAHSALGLAFMETGQHDKAIAEHEIATTLNPNSSFGQWSCGYALNRADRFAEALQRFDMALRLSPRDPATWSYLTLRASVLYQLGEYEAAAASAREATRAQVVDLIWPPVHLAAALGRLGRKQEAHEAIEALLRIRPGLTIAGFRAWPHNQHRSAASLENVVVGLRAAGLAEDR